MRGQYTKRKIKKAIKKIQAYVKEFFYKIKKAAVKKSVKNQDFSIISNNCWAGTVYQYLDMPYLSPTAGLYFFAPDYIKFVSDLHHYLNSPLVFIDAKESKYYEELKRKKETERIIGVIDDVEIVFLHYKSKEEAKEKWERRKARVNYNNIILKFSRMNMCSEKELEAFDSLPFANKIIINNRITTKYKSEIHLNLPDNEYGIIRDNEPFPGKLKLKKILNNANSVYPENGLSKSANSKI